MKTYKDNISDIIAELTRSDELLGLREIIGGSPGLQDSIGNAIQFRVVIDTNVVLRDLIFLSKKAQKADARTSLLEAIAAGTVVPHAPTWLCVEVEKHLPLICEKKGIELEVIVGCWEEYRQKIQFFDISDDQLTSYADSVDPKDAPFIVLEKQINALGVLSDDAHIEKMGGTRISLDVVISMRDYSRHAAVEFKIKYMGVVTGALSIGAVASVIKGIKNIIPKIGKLPQPLLYAAIGIAIWVVLDPKMRTRAMEKLKGFGEAVSPFLGGMRQIIAELATLAISQAEQARKHHETINQGIIKPYEDLDIDNSIDGKGILFKDQC